MSEMPVRSELRTRALSYSIGTIVDGVDLRELSPIEIDAIRQLWLERKVLFFPGQHLDADSHLAFAAHFGEISEGHPVIPGIPGNPRIFQIDYSDDREVYASYGDTARTAGLDWHTDVTFVERPPMGSILSAVAIPPSGGDTMFSDQGAAFAALSPRMQDFLEGLTAVHDGQQAFQYALDFIGAGTWEGQEVTSLKQVIHPVVRTHPETGQRSLFVNPAFTTRIAELELSESEALLAFLYRHAVRPEFTVRYHWTTGDVGFWDNRATQHAVVGDYRDQKRVIQRVTLRGDEPV